MVLLKYENISCAALTFAAEAGRIVSFVLRKTADPFRQFLYTIYLLHYKEKL